MVMGVNWKLLRIWKLGMRRGGLMVLPGHEVGFLFSSILTLPCPSSLHRLLCFQFLLPSRRLLSLDSFVHRVHWNLSPTTRTKLTIASNRPSVRSVFPSERKDEKKTRSGFSTHSNSTATPSKGREKGRESEITIKGSDREKEGSWGRKRGKRTPLLIKHLGGVERRKGESHNLESSAARTVAADLLHPILHSI
jgi:hypothetical protein